MKFKNVLLNVVAVVGIATLNFAQTVPNYVPTNGLVGWWPFNGNANDESGGGYNGTVNGATLTTDRFGNANKAYYFDGLNDYITTNYSGVLGSANRSISFWAKHIESFNPNQCASCSRKPAITYGTNIQGPNQIGQGFNCEFNQGLTGVCFDGNETTAAYSTNSPVNDGNWHHYVYVFENVSNVTSVKIYQDAILLIGPSFTYLPNNNLNTTLGSNMAFGRRTFNQTVPAYYKGNLDDIGFWNRALTNCEIYRLYISMANITNNSNTTILTCAQPSISVTAGNGTSYLWSGGNSTTTASNTFTQPGTYTVTVTAANGCTATSSITLTQNNTPPTASITNNNNTTVLTCAQQSISVIAGNGNSYLWSGGNSTTTASNSLSQPGTYTVTVTAANGCTATNSITLTQDISAPAANISGVNTICSGDNTTLTASNGSGYLWSNGLNTPSITVSQGGQYTVNVTYANGCTASASLVLTVNEPSSSIANQTACDSYTWNNQTYTQSGQYTFLSTNAVGCDSISNLNLVILEETSFYQSVTICLGSVFNIGDSSYTTSGIYTNVFIGTNGCDSTVTTNLSVKDCNGIDYLNTSIISIYPNPTKDIVSLQVKTSMLGKSFTILDLMGKILQTGKIISEHTSISLNQYSDGVYLIRVGDDQQKHFRIIKQ